MVYAIQSEDVNFVFLFHYKFLSQLTVVLFKTSFVPFYQRSFYKISSMHSQIQEMQFKMRWKHQHHFRLPQAGALERVSFQRAGGQRDHA